MSNISTDAPPPYTGPPAATSGAGPSTFTSASTSAPNVQHKTRNGIPPQARRSMEDEYRPLPKGWTRQFDPETKHQFFVDTTKEPPRSIWTHPYDDFTYLSSLPEEERTRILNMHKVPSHDDMLAESTDEEDGGDDEHSHAKSHHAGPSTNTNTNASKSNQDHHSGGTKLGRRMKDKLTGTTHAEREAKRQKRAEEERRAYQVHQALRNAMSQAMQTGQPVRAMRDSEGHDIWVEPPDGYARPLAAGAAGPVDRNGRSVNPYARSVCR